MQTEQERVPFTGGGEENSLFGACTEREGVNRGNYNKGTVTHLSTSSLSMINSFFNTLIAYKLFVFFSSASMTFPKLPFPKTAKKLKSSSPTLRLRTGCRYCCCGEEGKDACRSGGEMWACAVCGRGGGGGMTGGTYCFGGIAGGTG